MTHKPEFNLERTKLEQFLELLEITNAHPSSKRFYELIMQAAWLHARKQEDYGSDDDPFANIRSSQDFGTPGWVGAFIRLNDKVQRIKSFARRGKLSNESAEDSMKDIAVYALIGLVMYEEESKQDQKEHLRKISDIGQEQESHETRPFPDWSEATPAVIIRR